MKADWYTYGIGIDIHVMGVNDRLARYLTYQ